MRDEYAYPALLRANWPDQTDITPWHGGGHRRYAPETVRLLESLSCLRKSGLSIEDMRKFLAQREEGYAAAARQKALFAEHQERVERELRQLQVRKQYLEGKVAYWAAIEAGDLERVARIGKANQLVAKHLT